MGRRKKPKESGPEDGEDAHASEARRGPADSSDESCPRRPRQQHDLDPRIEQFAMSFGIDQVLTQELNDLMLEERKKTIEQDLERLYEILNGAWSPTALLKIKMADMEKGTFVGKVRCGPKVRELALKHKLDNGASTKLEEAMGMREAMGKDIDKDLALLNEHLAASNKPSALVSQKLKSLREGYPIGHCIYSRETMIGGSGPGVDGVFELRAPKCKRMLGMSDADLERRFAQDESSSGRAPLMDEAAVRRLMAAERKRDMERGEEDTKKGKGRQRSRSRGRPTPSPQRRRGGKERSRSRGCESPRRKKSRSRGRRRSRGR